MRLLQFDFNLRGSIERALKINSVKALKTLLSHFFDKLNSHDYYPLIMNDLALVLDNKQVEINEFFELSAPEKKSKKPGAFCNIEIPFKKEINLPVFSDQ